MSHPLGEQHHRREGDPEAHQRDVHGKRQCLHLPGLQQILLMHRRQGRRQGVHGSPARYRPRPRDQDGFTYRLITAATGRIRSRWTSASQTAPASSPAARAASAFRWRASSSPRAPASCCVGRGEDALRQAAEQLRGRRAHRLVAGARRHRARRRRARRGRLPGALRDRRRAHQQRRHEPGARRSRPSPTRSGRRCGRSTSWRRCASCAPRSPRWPSAAGAGSSTSPRPRASGPASATSPTR